MLLFYIDESGNRDPRMKIPRADGSTMDGDPIYVLTAVSLFEHRWHGFEKTLNRHKNWLFPENSPLIVLMDDFERQRAGVPANSGPQMVSGGANPIEPTSGTGQKTG